MRDLCDAVALAAPASDCFACAMNDRITTYDYPPRVRVEIDEKDLDSYRQAADYLNFNNTDILCIQHEFGIFGGPSGSHLLSLLREVRMPIVTTFHTVLRDPNETQYRVMKELLERSDRVVVMAHKGLEILQEIYGVSESKVDIIFHGIPDIPFIDSSHYKKQFGVEGRKVLMTFGLLAPGKGIEYVIRSLPEIVKQYPSVVYLILGATHPNLVAKEGEQYRLSLERLSEDLGVKENVIFYNRFVSNEDLKEFIGATDIYITPYLNEAQITSGTLAYVFGAGKAVVSTPYWHAQELLADGKGILVPFRDSKAISDGVCTFLGDPERLKKNQEVAYAIGRKMLWSEVSEKYLTSFKHAWADRKEDARTAFAEWTLASRPYELPPIRLNHILAMTDGTGIFQHAIYNVPNFHEGYCTDDNARAFILCTFLEDLGKPPAENLFRLATTYLAFLVAAWNPEKKQFRNFMNHSRQWLEEVGSEDSQARALWALGVGSGHSHDEGHRKLSIQLFEQAFPITETFTSPRAWAFTLLGLHEYLHRAPNNTTALTIRNIMIQKLIQRWHDSATDEWPWFEKSITYENARLCQALIQSGRQMGDAESLELGLKTLLWLVAIQKTKEGHFRPIGCNGFYENTGNCAQFDQQPVEAQGMISACIEAFHATHEPEWLREAKCIFEWFLGRNDVSLSLYDSVTGGCGDGLHHDRVSNNQGAESTLAFHLALAEMNRIKFVITPVLGQKE